MEDLYFVPSFGNKPKHMVGREEVLQLFQQCLNSYPGSRERVLFLLGQRGAGKTVLLLKLAEMAHEKGYVVASPTIPGKDMLERILEKLRIEGGRILAEPRSTLSGGGLNIFGFGGSFQLQKNANPPSSFAQQLSRICQQCNKKNRGVMILVDEVQANQAELRQLVIAYQEMVGEGRDISLVLAGLPMAVSSVLNDHVLTFLNRAVKVELPSLKRNDIAVYYTKAFRELEISVEKEQIEKASDFSKGSPYLMQLIGHYIVLLTEKNNLLTNGDFLLALRNAEDTFKNDICRTTIEPLSDRDIDFLRAMAEDPDHSEISEIAQRLDKNGAYTQTYKRRLLQAGVIMQPRRGQISFAVPYLKEYLSDT